MRISELREQTNRALVDFAWDEWSQMGVLAAPTRQSPWAQDPEALLIFSLEVGRDDPRLFDELLDWLRVNEHLLSVRRLRALCNDAEDRKLVEGALAWVARYRPSARSRRSPESELAESSETLFRRSVVVSPRASDEAFAQVGLSRPRAEPTHKSQPPNVNLPINFAFRLRHLLGIGARAEVVRFMLTARVPHVTAQVVARSAGYAKRNVYEALESLRRADVLGAVTAGSEQRYVIDSDRWASLLYLSAPDLPMHRDWPQLLGALRAIVRWLERPDLDDLSEYMRASAARDLIDQIANNLAYAGIPTGPANAAAGPAIWDAVLGVIQSAAKALTAGCHRQGP